MAAKKRIAMVTGGMGGLGEAICIKLAAQGDTVVSTFSPSNTKSKEWLAAMKSQGYEFHAYACDVTDWNSCRDCVKKVTAEIGPVDVLVNNAGITRDMTFKKMDPVNWQAVMHSNLDSVFNMTKQVCEDMVERGWGRIINISSVNGQKGQFGQVNYSAAKAGDIGFTKALALENAKTGITVNVICPGYINTEMVQAVPKDVLEKSILPLIPVGRLGEPDEIARAVVFLAADESGAITGSTFSINGGQHMV